MSMCKFFKKTDSEKEPKSVIACYLQKLQGCLQELKELTGAEGNYAYRGQKNADWDVESGAFRRIEETTPLVKENKLPKEDFISYHEKELLEPARMEGHGVGEDRPLYDLELLAKLQHHGAATCLIDFTRNFLVAMWFACESYKEEEEEKDGEIFILDTSDKKNFLSLEEKDLEKKVRPILTFQTRKKDKNETISSKEEITFLLSMLKPSWWHWSPHGLLDQRIIKQDSLFIFGQPRIEDTPLKGIEIKHEHKDKILEELEKLGITERTLFKDLPGFAYSHDPNKSLPPGYGDAEYYLRKGSEALQRDDVEGAVADYNRAIELKPSFVEAHYSLGIVNLVLRRHSDAIANCNEAIKLKPDFAEAYFYRGIVKVDLGDFNGAIEDYNEAIKLKPDFAEAYHNRGMVKTDLSDHSGAIEDYNEAIKRKPDFAEAYYNRGDVNRILARNNNAIADYTRAIELKLDYAEAYRNRGNIKADLGYLRGAIADYDRAIKLKSDDAEAYNNRGNVNRSFGHNSEAIADYNEAIKLKPDYAVAYYNRGLVKTDLGNRMGAILDYNRAIEFNPDYAEAYDNRGLARADLGYLRIARADFDRVIELKPDYAKAYYSRGNVKYQLGNYAGAIADYDRAIELKPDYTEVYDNRGIAKHDLGDYTGAIANYNRAIELKPDYMEAYYNRGNVNLSWDRYSEAIVDYDRAIELNPDYAKAYNNRGVTYDSLGDKEKARRDFLKARKLAEQSGDKQLLGLIDKALSELDNGNNNRS